MQKSLRLPEIHVATARLNECAHIVSDDRRLPYATRLGIVRLGADTLEQSVPHGRDRAPSARDFMSTPTPLLSVRDLSVAFRHGPREVVAVDRVSFDIAKGETVALVGNPAPANRSRRSRSSSCCPIRRRVIPPAP